MTEISHRTFRSFDELYAWLKRNHEKEKQLWVRVLKKASGESSVTWEDCVRAVLCWGWIDSQKRALDENSYLQRLTPRRARSTWSKKNREHVEQLIEQGLMQVQGLVHVEAAKADGRWDKAYEGSRTMILPADFLAAVKRHPTAKRAFDSLKKPDLFLIYHRLHTARTPETRQRRFDTLLSLLKDGKPLRA